jgi:hypothetical protein
MISVISYQCPVISEQQPATSNQGSVVSDQLSVSCNSQPAISIKSFSTEMRQVQDHRNLLATNLQFVKVGAKSSVTLSGIKCGAVNYYFQ